MRWTPDQVGYDKRRREYFAFPRTPEGIAIRVTGESAEYVASAANAMEHLITDCAIEEARSHAVLVSEARR